MKYMVGVTRVSRVEEDAWIEVEAESEEDARTAALEVEDDETEWRETGSEAMNYEIVRCDLVTEEAFPCPGSLVAADALMREDDLRMQLWLLQPAPGVDTESKGGPFWYDRFQRFVIRAVDALAARELAAAAAGEDLGGEEVAKVWRDPAMTTCQMLNHAGKSGIVISDYLHG